MHRHADYISSADRRGVAQIYARERDDRSFEAWCALCPEKDVADFVVTNRETTRSSVHAVRFWTSALTHRYVEGALTRAVMNGPYAALQRHDPDATIRADGKRAEAEAYAAAADAAHDRAHELQVMQRAARRGVRFG